MMQDAAAEALREGLARFDGTGRGWVDLEKSIDISGDWAGELTVQQSCYCTQQPSTPNAHRLAVRFGASTSVLPMTMKIWQRQFSTPEIHHFLR